MFEIFQKYPRSPPIGRQALSVIFFFKFATMFLEKKGPVALPPAAPVGPGPPHGRLGLFFSKDFVANLKKKITLWA